MSYHFYPGWGFDQAAFDALKQYLKPIKHTMHIAHSHGLIKYLVECSVKTNPSDNLVIIGGFRDFKHWPETVIEKMIIALQQNPETVLKRFYKQCGLEDWPLPTKIEPPDLEYKLKELLMFQYQETMFMDKNILSIHGDNDHVAPAHNTLTKPCIIKDAGHCPHITHAIECAELINAVF